MKDKLPMNFYSSSSELEKLFEELKDRENLERLHDPKFILDKLLENCDEPDNRDQGIGSDAREALKARVLNAIELYETGDFKKLSYEMFHLGRETQHANYVPLLREGSTRVRAGLNAGAKTKQFWESEPTIKKQILILYPKKLEELGKPDAVKAVAEIVGSSVQYVNRIIRENNQK